MHTLINGSSGSRWYPRPITVYKRSIKVRGDYDEKERLKSNFAYNMQYIEYLEKQIAELRLSEVLYTMIYKSYIITGMGIIEALFANLLRATGNWKTTVWKECSNLVSNEKQIDGKRMRVETHLYEKVDSYEMRMDFDSMIKKVESKHLLSIDHDVFPALKNLRELRNRVHLQVGDNATDHDYNTFGYEEIQMMRGILYSILTCNEFCNDINVFSFIHRETENN